MLKLKSVKQGVKAFGVNSTKLVLLLKDKKTLKSFRRNLLEDPDWLIKNDFEPGRFYLINNYLLWESYYGELKIINLSNGKSCLFEGEEKKGVERYFLSGNPTCENSSFYIRTVENRINSFSKFSLNDDGAFVNLWEKEFKVRSVVEIPNEKTVFITANNQEEFIKLNALTGEIIWKKRFGLGRIAWIYGVRDKKILMWGMPNTMIAVNSDSGELEWVIKKIPKPKDWEDGANANFPNFKLSNTENLIIGIKGFHQWIVDIEKGIALPPIDYSEVFYNHGITYQSSAFFDLKNDYIIFFDEYERNVISFNWKTEEVESVTPFPIQGSSDNAWQGPIIEGDNCYLLDKFGTLFIFEKTTSAILHTNQ